MAKKSSTNAVKKLDKQINDLKKNSSSIEEKTPAISKKELKEGIEKAKVASTTKKTKKSSGAKKSTTKKTANSKTTSRKKTTAKKKTATKNATAKKSTTKKTPSSKVTSKIKKDAVVIAPDKPVKLEEKKEKIDKPIRDEIVVTPSEKDDSTVFKDEAVKDEVLVAPDKKEKTKDSDSKNDISVGEKSKRILRKEKKFEFVQEKKEEKIDSHTIADDIENDINNGKYIDKAKILIDKSSSGNKKVKRKRKGKNKYIIDLESTREYKDLERDLRSLYDKTNDIIDDIDRPVRDEIVDINKLDIHNKDIEEKKGILDRISQKVLNIFIAILSVIFIILLIVVIGFIIYVSTV